MREATQVDPVIIVIPAASGLLSADFYLSIATAGQLLFENAEAASSAIASTSIAGAVVSIDTASDYALSELQRLRAELRALIVAIAVMVIVVVLAIVVAVQSYCESYRHVLFARYGHGWGFIRSHRVALAAAVGWPAIVIAVAMIVDPSNAGAGKVWALGIVIASLIVSMSLIRVNEHNYRGDVVRQY